MGFTTKHENLALLTVKNKIELYIKAGFYSDLEDFIKSNPDLKTFQERTKLNKSIRQHFGCEINEADYQRVLNELKAELEEKLRIEKERITTVTVGDKEIATYHGEDKQIVVDNSYAGKPVEAQLEELQEKYSRFRDPSMNQTEQTMEYMQAEVKPTPTFTNVIDFPSSPNMSQQEQEIVEVAEAYRDAAEGPVQVDIENSLIMAGEQILSIENHDGEYGVFAPEENTLAEEEQQLTKAPQKVKKKTAAKKNSRQYKQAGYSSAIALALLTGVFMGLAVLNLYLKLY